MTDDPRMSAISAAIDRARPAIQADGGDIRLVGVDGIRVRVELSGKCTSCALAAQTLGGLRRQLMADLGEPVLVVPA